MSSTTRRSDYSRLSTALARLDDRELGELIGVHQPTGNWGEARTVELDGSKLFVKRVPVTDLEVEHRFSTRNLYEIPPFYNYGVGSAGFGVFRELVSHVATTNWVLEGVAKGLPLMYHHRLLELPEPWGTIDADRHSRYVAYWNNDPGVDRYMRDRADARHELVVVLEHVPFTMAGWLLENPSRVDDVVAQLFETIGFLHARGVAHFDAHFSNVVTDGAVHLLVDYGLVLDANFQLDEAHREFLERHWHYDYGEVIYSVGAQLAWMFFGLPPEDQHRVREALVIPQEASADVLTTMLVERIEKLSDVIPLDAVFVAAIERYREPMLFMNEFFVALRNNPRKDTPFDDDRLRSLLLDAGLRIGRDASGTA